MTLTPKHLRFSFQTRLQVKQMLNLTIKKKKKKMSNPDYFPHRPVEKNMQNKMTCYIYQVGNSKK